MDYKSPIEVIMGDLVTDIKKQQDDAIYQQITQQIGVIVDKEELFKALKYDRNQYCIGFRDAQTRYTRLMMNLIEDIRTSLDDIEETIRRSEI